MSQTLEQFQAYQTRLEQYDQAIALLYWDLQTAAPKRQHRSKAVCGRLFFHGILPPFDGGRIRQPVKKTLCSRRI